jgi:hypothetical protein
LALEVLALPSVGLVGAGTLLLERLHHRRQQAVQAQPEPLLRGEGGAPVGDGVLEQRRAGGQGTNGVGQGTHRRPYLYTGWVRDRLARSLADAWRS